MTGRILFPLNPIYSVGLLLIPMLLGKIASTNNLIPQLAYGVCAIWVPLFLLVSLLDTQKASVPMLARVDQTC
jgi:hypothetical protein